MNPHALADTSALVLLWDYGTVHTSRQSRAYLDLLDLEAGRGLMEECDRVWPHFGELIKNRKRRILDSVLGAAGPEGAGQVAIFGSGMDALSVELASRAPGITVYDADIANMDLKGRLIRQAGGGLADSIRCVTADMSDADGVVSALEGSGWDASEPSVLVFEGISYYLAEDDLWGLIAKFVTKGLRNTLLLEYLVRRQDITHGRSDIPDLAFGTIQKAVGHKFHIARYGPGEIEERIGRLGGRMVRRHTMRDMEKDRTGGNAHFGTDGSGWIEIGHMRI